MADIIDMFTRQPIDDDAPPVRRGPAAEGEDRRWFKEWAGRAEQLGEDEQVEWIVLFNNYYLGEFLDAVEGIREATAVADLEHFLSVVAREVQKWPKS